MKFHRSLRPEDVLRHGPAKIALMVASEFYRASSGAKYTSNVIACYDRARELMGLLETIPFQENVAADLKPAYQECRYAELVREDRLSPDYIREFGIRLAEQFEKAAEQMASDA